jgi:hypothetical protein
MLMSDELVGLVVSLVAGAVVFTIAQLIRVRGPVGLVKNVDWSRVSDPQALGHYVSLMMTLMGALIAAHGVALYAFRTDHATRNLFTTGFVVLIAVLTLAIIIGQQRYQDKPRRDGR